MTYEESQRQKRLMLYMRGFKKGASGSAIEDREQINQDFMAGHKVGREATQKAYKEAVLRYEATLNPLRAVVPTIQDRVERIIVEQLGVNPEQVTPNASFIEDLGADSLDTVELVMAFEEEFNIEVPEEDAENVATVADAIEYVKTHAPNISSQ